MKLKPIQHSLFALAALFALPMTQRAEAQTAVPVPGGGSYASDVPPADLPNGYDGPIVSDVLADYNTLLLDPAKKNGPIPTNRWWTNLMVSATNPFSTTLWLYPGNVHFNASGMTLYYPKAWVPRSASAPYTPSGSFDSGPALTVDSVIPLHSDPTDVVLGDFSGSAYPAGWTATGGLAGTAPIQGGSWPGENPTVTGYIGSACVNTYRGTNATTGSLTSPVFQIKDHFINVLVGGGTDPVNTVVKLTVNGQIVDSTTGADGSGNPDVNMHWVQWDVSAYQGQNGQLAIVDNSTAGWGFILCSYIVETNNTANPATLYTTSLNVANGTITNWGDWNLDYAQASAYGNSIQTSVARGIPFIWSRYTNVSPQIHAGVGTPLYDVTGNPINTASGSFTASCFAFTITDSSNNTHTFGVFAPDNTTFTIVGDAVLANNPAYLVYGFLPNVAALSEFNRYAFARPTNTQITWNYDHTKGQVAVDFVTTTTPLKGTNLATIQGWLPHQWRTLETPAATSDAINLTEPTPGRNVLSVNGGAGTVPAKNAFLPYTYLTPRGMMKMTIGTQKQFIWPFRGITPTLPAPHVNGVANDYNAARLTNYMTTFAANHPGTADETYFGGKEIGTSAHVMAMDAQLGLAGPFNSIETNLSAQLADWFTYTPGEPRHFFASYNNWKGLIGFDVSFGSQGFNDLHFHYGYFAVTSALVGMHDPAFLNQYGGMARQLVKAYANWDRTDPNFPFLRMFDVWEGHSGAGGFADGQGENQESSSEAMNSWAGMFLLGNMLGDKAMTDAGAMGYAVESAAVNEYWQDWKHTNLPASYGIETTGILFSSGIAAATYFTGDPVWFDAIQWTTTNIWNNYLVRDKTVAANQLAQMWVTRQSYNDHAIGGFSLNGTANTVEGVAASGGPGSSILGFQLMFDPATVAQILDNDYATSGPLATDGTYSGENYYLTHSLRGLGDPDFTSYTTIPTSAVYLNAGSGVRTYVLYNPQLTAQTATVYVGGQAAGTIVVPARRFVSTTQLNSGSAAATPYYLVAASVPGTLHFVNYDSGGEGFGYHKVGAVNPGNPYRPNEAVNIVADSEGGFCVTGSTPGEWTQYGVQVPATGTYGLSLRVAAATTGGAFHIADENGINLTGTLTVPNTGSLQTWTTLSGSVALTAGNHTLRLVTDTGGYNIATASFVGIGTNIPANATISLKSLGDSMYVTAEAGGAQPLIANRTAAAGWEQFTVLLQANGTVAFQSHANNQYVTVTTDGTKTLIASKTTIGANETFRWYDLGNGQVALQSVGNGLFVSVTNNTTSLMANQTTYGTASTFLVTTY